MYGNPGGEKTGPCVVLPPKGIVPRCQGIEGNAGGKRVRVVVVLGRASERNKPRALHTCKWAGKAGSSISPREQGEGPGKKGVRRWWFLAGLEARRRFCHVVVANKKGKEKKKGSHPARDREREREG